MFIYFPEFIYRKSKEFVKFTFAPSLSDRYTKAEIAKLLSSDEFSSHMSEIRKNNILLPRVNLKHCVRFSINSSLIPISEYDIVTNQINICANMLGEKFKQTIRKEFSYFYDLNLKYAGKDLNLNEYTLIALRACFKSFGDSHLSRNMKIELAKRCSFVEMKYKYGHEIIKKCEQETVNALIKRLIEQNLNIIN
jgi:hypothetical protein